MSRNSLWQSLHNLWQYWWRVDQIRVSRREGELLSLAPPCLLQVGSQIVEVLKRSVGETEQGPYVLYQCTDAFGEYELWVNPVASGRWPQVRWVNNGREQELSADDIQVYKGENL